MDEEMLGLILTIKKMSEEYDKKKRVPKEQPEEKEDPAITHYPEPPEDAEE